MPLRRKRRVLAGLVFALLTLACSEPARPNVVVVLFDTLRRDHVGTYGYARDTTPTIDAIAQQGLVFEETIAQSSWTRPSVTSLFTSRYHSEFHPEHYAGDSHGHDINAPLPDEALTLAEMFGASGYRTVSATTNLNLAHIFNLDQGFEERFFEARAPADWVVDRALEVFQSGGTDERPIFLYLHFMEPHPPFDPPEPYASMYPTSDGKPHRRGHKEFSAFADFGTEEKLQSDAYRSFKSHVVALYDGSIRFGDQELSRLVGKLQHLDLWDDTIFVFLSDHGESFWDRPLLEKSLGLQSFLKPGLYGVGHGHTLFPEQVGVPLIIRGPGVPVGRVSEQVRLIDVAPTLMSLARVSHPDFEPRGEDLIVNRGNGALIDRTAYSETSTQWGHQRSIQDTDFQYIEIHGDEEHLFRKHNHDLERALDPSPEDLAGFREAMRAEVFAQRVEPGEIERQPATGVDPSTCRELAVLGYVEPESCDTSE